MSENGRPVLTRLLTGVPGLDEVLGGGLPEYSFNLIAGEPGSGKTTLAHQIMFANASVERKALYFTVLGEPPLKMWRYLQQMFFFDPGKVEDSIRFVDLSQAVLQQDLGEVLEIIVKEVREMEPAVVVVDSFRTLVRSSAAREELALQSFVQRLALHLTSWQATTFLVGEYHEVEMRDNPIFTVADSVIWLSQSRERSSIVRKLQVMKLRGQASMPGLHTFRIDAEGLHLFPRVLQRTRPRERTGPGERIKTGISGLDPLLGGGIPVGDTVLIAGPSGTGKTCFSTQFIAASEEPSVLAVFEEDPQDYLQRASGMGFNLVDLVHKGTLRVISLRPLDLSGDETLQEIRGAVESMDAKRLVIDSLTGFEVALAPSFREDFRESLYRMLGVLTGTGVTVLMTVETTDSWQELRFNPHQVSFLTDNIFLLRYAEIDGELKKVFGIVKMRRSAHATTLHELEITPRGVLVKGPLRQYQGVWTGAPRPREAPVRPPYPGLIEEEAVVLELLLESGEVTEEAVTAATGQKGPSVARALGRLVALNYAIKVVEDERTLYRPLARALGQ